MWLINRLPGSACLRSFTFEHNLPSKKICHRTKFAFGQNLSSDGTSIPTEIVFEQKLPLTESALGKNLNLDISVLCWFLLPAEAKFISESLFGRVLSSTFYEICFRTESAFGWNLYLDGICCGQNLPLDRICLFTESAF